MTRFANAFITLMLLMGAGAGCRNAEPSTRPHSNPPLPWIRVSTDKTHFVRGDSGERIVMWGFNYDHDDAGRKKSAHRQFPAGGDVDEHAGEREKIWVNPKADTRGDDEPQRVIARPADGASECHGL